jgi:hypothetical protein
MLTRPTSKTDPQKLMRLACHAADENLTGLLTTTAIPNRFEKDELARLGCVFLGGGLSTINRVTVQRADLINILNLGFVLDFELLPGGW